MPWPRLPLRGIIAAVVGAVVAAAALGLATEEAEAQPGVGARERTVRLEPGWNLVGWTGDTAPAGPALAFARSRPTFGFDPVAQAFHVVWEGRPAPSDAQEELHYGDALWVFADERRVWRQPVNTSARRLALAEGFTLVTWTGPTHTPVAEALVSIARDVSAVFWYDAILGRYVTYRPGLPAALSDLRALHYGEAIWVQTTRPTVWLQPGPLSSRCAPFPDPQSRLGEWTTFDAGRVVIAYQAGSAAAAHRAAVAVAALTALADVEARLAIPAGGVITVRLYEDLDRLREATGTTFSGWAQPSARTVHLLCGPRALGLIRDLPSLPHELAHILSVREHGPNILFLAEGIAGWAENGIGLEPLRHWIERGTNGRYPAVVDILDDADYLATPDTSHALATSSLLTKYLIERRGGLARFWALWSAVSLVGVEEAPEAVYGASWAELDRAMRAWLGILPGRG